MQMGCERAWLPQRQAPAAPKGGCVALSGAGGGRPRGRRAPGSEPGTSPWLCFSRVCEPWARQASPTGWPAAAQALPRADPHDLYPQWGSGSHQPLGREWAEGLEGLGTWRGNWGPADAEGESLQSQGLGAQSCPGVAGGFLLAHMAAVWLGSGAVLGCPPLCWWYWCGQLQPRSPTGQPGPPARAANPLQHQATTNKTDLFLFRYMAVEKRVLLPCPKP